MKWRFKCEEHKEYGSKGWRLANMPAFDPLGGMAVAHDTLEHWRGDDSTTGELMALGAMLWVRGSEYFARTGRFYTAPSYHFNGELEQLMLNVQHGTWCALRPYIGRTTWTTDEWARNEIAEGIRLARKAFRDEWPEERTPTASEWRLVRKWITYGYNRARARYKSIPQSTLVDVFCEIEEKADELLKIAEPSYSELVVSLTWRSGALVDARKPQLSITMIGEE